MTKMMRCCICLFGLLVWLAGSGVGVQGSESAPGAASPEGYTNKKADVGAQKGDSNPVAAPTPHFRSASLCDKEFA